MPLQGPSPIPGDLIEFFRPVYQHWGVYVGQGYVVHLTDQDGWISISSAFGEKAVVRKDHIDTVAAGCIYRVNNKYDKKRSPYPPGKVVKAALEQVGEQLDYSVTSANCEHFATELRYGNRSSQQVDQAFVAAGVGAGVFIAAGLIAGVLFTSIRNKRQNQ
ncbi:phospholipase A and acyltransferase 3-like [Pseudophryne corroboree]|uniref:phospholipase A and acyltransferase 3-like n=1 Tax=Pseudophryne corroboree TaxID=495146 RepID=UPI0030818A39